MQSQQIQFFSFTTKCQVEPNADFVVLFFYVVPSGRIQDIDKINFGPIQQESQNVLQKVKL